jgi:biopolymer transport protein ExbD
MSIKSGGFKRKSKASDGIPSSSMADIAFLLLIFFMVTTVFRASAERPIEWTAAEAAQKIDEKAKDILYVWLETDGSIWINDRQYPMGDVSGVVAPLYASSERRLVVSLRADRDVAYIFVDQLQTELQEAGAVRLVFATVLERRMTRERR